MPTIFMVQDHSITQRIKKSTRKDGQTSFTFPASLGVIKTVKRFWNVTTFPDVSIQVQLRHKVGIIIAMRYLYLFPPLSQNNQTQRKNDEKEETNEDARRLWWHQSICILSLIIHFHQGKQQPSVLCPPYISKQLARKNKIIATTFNIQHHTFLTCHH